MKKSRIPTAPNSETSEIPSAATASPIAADDTRTSMTDHQAPTGEFDQKPDQRHEPSGEIQIEVSNRLPQSRTGRIALAGMAAATMGAKQAIHLSKSRFADATTQALRDQEHHEAMAKTLFETLCQLRGTALKLAQVLCADGTMLPEVYAKELRKSQYQVPPIRPPLIRKVIKAELGQYPEQIFKSFAPQAFAAASLGQVHAAISQDGDELAVKIQYPGIAKTIASDLSIAKALVSPLLRSQLLVRTLDEIETGLFREVDYGLELKHLEWFATLFADSEFLIPQVDRELSSSKVLTMRRLPGLHLDPWLLTESAPAARARVAEQMFRFFCQSLFSHGAIHADPNLGNYLIQTDGRLGVIDFGAVKDLNQDVVLLFRGLWTDPSRLPSEALLSRYQNLGAEISLDDQEDGAEFARVLIDPYRHWIAKFFEDETYDFAGESEHANESTRLLARQIFHPRLGRFTADFALIHRTVSGLFQAFIRMGARPRLREIVAPYLHA